MNIRVPQNASEALSYLYRDPFPNANLISAIEQGPLGTVEVRVADDGAPHGVLVLAPGPDGGRTAGLDADNLGVAEALLRTLRLGERLQFAIHRPAAVTALSRVCAAPPAGVMLAFRCEEAGLRPHLDGREVSARTPHRAGPDGADPGAAVAVGRAAAPALTAASPARELTRTDERAVRQSRDDPFLMSFLQATRGRPLREGAEVHTFGVIEGGRLLARCLTTWGLEGIERQIGTVWSVYTDPAARGRGLGSAVVSAATAAILASGRVARYFAFSDNIPSLQICRSLGYVEDHTVRYFWGHRRPSL